MRKKDADRVVAAVSAYADSRDERIVELEIAIRAALSFVQERFSSHGTYSDGHAQMVALALRGALRNAKT